MRVAGIVPRYGLGVLKEELRTRAGVLMLGLSLFFIVLPLLVKNQFFINALFVTFLYAIMTLAWAIACGQAGMLSFGHSAFFGIAAYTTMVLLHQRITPWLGIPIGALLAGLFGFALGLLFARLRSHWFALATLVLNDIFRLIFENWEEVGGMRGLEIPYYLIAGEPSLYWLNFIHPRPFYYLALGTTGLELLVIYLLTKSKIGYYLKAIREDEEAARSVGINITLYKGFALGLSAFFMGLAGGLYTIRYGYIDPAAVFNIMRISIYPAIAGLLGGVYSLVGPVVGCLIFIPVAEYTRAYIGGWLGARFYGIHLVFFGILLLMVSLKVPEGIMGFLEKAGYIKPLLSTARGSGGGEGERETSPER